MSAPDAPRWALAATLFGLVAATSYVAMRVASAVSGEATAGSVLAAAHVPYYWRVGLAVFHGGIAALLAGLALSSEAAERWLAHLAPWVLPLMAVLIVTMLAVP